MKAQISNLALIIIFSILVMSGTVYFVIENTKNISESVSIIEYDLFTKNLENSLIRFQRNKNRGAREVLELNVPRGIKKICFIDRKNNFNEFYSPEMTYKINLNALDNFFIEPEDIPSKLIKGFVLEESSNPLCFNTRHSKLNIFIEHQGNATKILNIKDIEEIDEKCVPLIYEGNPSEKIDLVFLSHNYKNREFFIEDVLNYISLLKNTPPFDEKFQKFNIFITYEEPICELKGFIRCDNHELQKIASNCPNDYVFLITDRKRITDILLPLRSSAIGNIAKINNADNELVFIHEFGHTFADLWDEYVEDSYYEQIISYKDYYKLPNCDKELCEKWKYENGSFWNNADCFKGCTLSSFYRGTLNSIMNNYRRNGGNEFGAINEKIILKILEKYS